MELKEFIKIEKKIVFGELQFSEEINKPENVIFDDNGDFVGNFEMLKGIEFEFIFAFKKEYFQLFSEKFSEELKNKNIKIIVGDDDLLLVYKNKKGE